MSSGLPQFDVVSATVARSLRAHRVARGLSLSELARRASVSKTILSRIESGMGNPSLETMWRVAGALDVPLGTLLGEGEPPRTRVIRADEGELVESESGFVGRLILGEGRNHRTEVFDFSLAAGVEYRSDPHPPGTEELVICLEGLLTVGPIGGEVELSEYDSLWFPADVSHRYVTADGARGLDLISYPAAQGPGG